MPSFGGFCPAAIPGNSPEGKAHPRLLECDCRQVVQAQSSNPDRVVPISAVVQSLVLQMGPSTAGPVCHPVQSQTPQVCFTSSRSESLGSGYPEPPMEGSGCLHLSTSLTTQPGGLQGDGPRLSQNDLNCTRLAQHALVLGPSQPVGADSLGSTSTVRSGDTTIQQASSPRSQESEPACLAPRASVIQEQVAASLMKWQQELRLLRDYQQEQSTNQSGLFLSTGAGLMRWTSGRRL